MRKTSSRRRLLHMAALGAAFCAFMSTTAQADDGAFQMIIGQPDQAAINRFSDCPPTEAFPEHYVPLGCMTVTARNGELKIGKTVATVPGPIRIPIGIGTKVSGPADLPQYTTVMPEGAGTVSPVKIPGGILGIAALDPIIDLDPLDLLSLSAIPEMGAAAAGNPEDPNFENQQAGLVFWLGGGGGTGNGQHTLHMPLSITLKNTLLGTDCKIPEFKMNLTTGTATVPAGVTPLQGDLGHGNVIYYVDETVTDVLGYYSYVEGTRFVDNGFAVGGPTGCTGPLGAAGILGPLNPLPKLVGLQAGVPAVAGTSYAKFTIDFAFSGYQSQDPAGLADRS